MITLTLSSKNPSENSSPEHKVNLFLFTLQKECAEAKTKIRPTYKKNLFKHIGLYSSLKGKLQKVEVNIERIFKYV